MQNFRVEVSKWVKKYNLLRRSETDSLLRQELHKEWFAILSIQVIDTVVVSWNKFYFEILQTNWDIKIWTISSNDIFLAYLKIKEDLKYNLKYIYPDKDTSLEEKENIIHDLEEQYKIYLILNKKELKKIDDSLNEKIKVNTEIDISNFQMKKELDNAYKIIDKVLLKLRFFLELEINEYLTLEKKEKLKEVYNVILRLKNTTNIAKLYEIWELALLKVWEIELKILEGKKDQKISELLKETNKLLKQVGSKTHFLEKDKDLNYILQNILKSIIVYLKFNKNETLKIDKTSNVYLKTKLLYNNYDNKLKDLDKIIIQNLYIFLIPTPTNREKRYEYLIRKKILKQNLMILKSRLNWSVFSYIKIVKWYNYFVNLILIIIGFFKNYLLFISFIYSILFIFPLVLNYFKLVDISFNFNWLFYFLFINISFILLNFSKWLITLIINIVILFFIFILWVINF